jgi:hypothetical protein
MEFRLWLENNSPRVKELFSKGINRKDPSILGYHGTSIQTMRALIEKGYLPVSNGLKGVFGNVKDKAYGIHVAPNMENKVVKTMEFRNPQTEDPYDDAMGFAALIAARHAFFDRHEMDMNKASHHRAADDMRAGPMISGREPKDIIKRLKINPEAKEAVEGGVVLAISDRVAEKFRIIVGGDGNDINIITNALPIEYILGIEPQNDAAYHWMDGLPI